MTDEPFAVRMRKTMNASFSAAERVQRIRHFAVPEDREDLIELLKFAAANSRRRFIMPSLSAGWRWPLCWLLGAFLTYCMFGGDKMSEDKEHDMSSVIIGGMVLFGTIGALWWGRHSNNKERHSHNLVAEAWRDKLTDALNTAQHVLTRPGDDQLIKQVKAKVKESMLAKLFH